MISRVRVRNFQSIKTADVELGRFTVIVGPSSSGKSAFLRALRTLVYNAATPSFVTHGERAAMIRAQIGDGEVSLERGKALSTYRIISGDLEEVYAKSGTSVPDEVRRVLGFAEVENDPLNFAFQFDRPYLLSESGTKVAKVIGELTNINVLYDAVREANRRRLESGSKLKVRVADFARLKEKAQEFRDLKARMEARTQARDLYDQLEHLEKERVHLDQIVSELLRAESLLKDLPELPEIAVEDLEELAQEVRMLRGHIEDMTLAALGVKEAKADVKGLGELIEHAHANIHQRLVKAGKCPVCGQEVS